MSENWKTPQADDGQTSAWTTAKTAGHEGSFTEVKTTSWFERLKGVVVGLLIGRGATAGLVWRARQRPAALRAGAG